MHLMIQWKLPKAEEGKRYPGTGSMEGPISERMELRDPPRHVIIKTAKLQLKRILKEARKEELQSREPP